MNKFKEPVYVLNETYADNMCLMSECTGFVSVDLNETAGSRLKFRGKFQEANTVNKNRRMYPYDILEGNVRRLEEAVKGRGLLGELDHPTDSIVHFENASHLITKLWWDNQVLMGEGEVLDTPSGKVLKSLLQAGVRVGVSSRGVGNGNTNEDGVLVIGESFKLITFDVVADPSTKLAFQSVVDAREEFKISNNSGNPAARRAKNEASRINNVNARAFISFLGCVFETKTNEAKERLHS